MPVLSIGKDVFCDSALILYTILQHAKKELSEKPESYGYEKGIQTFADALFQSILPLIPGSILSDGFVKDRASIFPILGRSDFHTLRPSALGESKAQLDGIESNSLGGAGPFLNGKSQLGVDDIHLSWVVRWTLKALGVEKEPGFAAKDFPKIYKWLDALPPLDENMERKQLSGEEASKTILESDYTIKNLGVLGSDPLGVKQGEKVSVESAEYVALNLSRWYSN